MQQQKCIENSEYWGINKLPISEFKYTHFFLIFTFQQLPFFIQHFQIYFGLSTLMFTFYLKEEQDFLLGRSTQPLGESILEKGDVTVGESNILGQPMPHATCRMADVTNVDWRNLWLQ